MNASPLRNEYQSAREHSSVALLYYDQKPCVEVDIPHSRVKSQLNLCPGGLKMDWHKGERRLCSTGIANLRAINRELPSILAGIESCTTPEAAPGAVNDCAGIKSEPDVRTSILDKPIKGS